MTPGTAIIIARSERQAMDWSLVLASQDIETFIDRAPEGGDWQLIVPEAEQDRAREAIRLYRRENLGRAWQQELRWTGLLFDWRAAFWFLLLIAFHFLPELAKLGLSPAGRMDRLAVLNGEWWRLFTAVTLHADVAHLAANVTTGLILLGLAMGSFGAGTALLTTFLAGAAGNLAGLFLHDGKFLSLGASGMVMGALGLLTAHSLSFWRARTNARQLIGRGVIAAFLLFVLLGLNPRSDVLAHLGGFVAGILFGVLLVWLPARCTKNIAWDRAATLLTMALVIVTWWRALR